MIPVPSNLALKLVGALCAILALALLINDRNRWKATASLRQQQVSAEKAAHSATAANYRAAAEQARNSDAANAARVRAEQAAISERTANDFDTRIAAARARSGRLRSGDEAAAADPGSRGGAPVPRLSPAAQGTAQGAGEDGFPPPDPMTVADRLIATEQAIQLDELIKWVKAQAAVPQNQ